VTTLDVERLVRRSGDCCGCDGDSDPEAVTLCSEQDTAMALVPDSGLAVLELTGLGSISGEESTILPLQEVVPRLVG